MVTRGDPLLQSAVPHHLQNASPQPTLTCSSKSPCHALFHAVHVLACVLDRGRHPLHTLCTLPHVRRLPHSCEYTTGVVVRADSICGGDNFHKQPQGCPSCQEETIASLRYARTSAERQPARNCSRSSANRRRLAIDCHRFKPAGDNGVASEESMMLRLSPPGDASLASDGAQRAAVSGPGTLGRLRGGWGCC